MPSITLRPHLSPTTIKAQNPLPQLLHTPLGLALVEIQGTLNIPDAPSTFVTPPSHTNTSDADDEVKTARGTETSQNTSAHQLVGRLTFPLLDVNGGSDGSGEVGEGEWMKKVYFYVGRNQRLMGEVRRLGRVVAVVRRRVNVVGKGGSGSGRRYGNGSGTGTVDSNGNGFGADSGEVNTEKVEEDEVMEAEGDAKTVEEDVMQEEDGTTGEELEIAALVKWKIFFGGRPEFV